MQLQLKLLGGYELLTALVSDAPDGSETYAVKSERRTSSRFEIQGFTNKLTRLTGRKQELAELKEVWQSARDGSGHVVALQGEPGIGKSRLLHSFQQEALPDAPMILQISGSPYHRQSALFPLILCLQALLGTDQIADAESKQRQISAWLHNTGLESPKFQGVLTVLLSGQTGDRARGVQGPALSQPAPPVEVLTRFFKAISQTQPMILIVEDLHWMDPTTQDLVHSLANQIGDLPVMIVVTLRPETAQKWLKTTPVHMIDLNRLHPQMSEEFVREICPPDWSQDMIDQVVQRSDGVPLYLEELVGAICGAKTGPLLIPESLQALLMGRIDRLEAAKGILQIASVIGRVFEHGLLARVVDCGEAELEKQLAVLWGLWGYYVVRADIRTATDIGAQFLSLALRQKDVNEVIAGHYVMGVTQFYAGNLADSEQSFKSGLALYQPHNQVEQTLRFGLDFSVTMQAYFATGAELARPYAQLWLAEAQANKGAVDQGLALVQDTLAFSERSGETYFDAELWRLQAYLLMQKGGHMVDTAEACLTRSMQASAKSGAYLLHLRAATQYAQLLHRQGRSAEAVILLNRAIKITAFSPELLAMCQVQTVLAELSA